MTASGTDDAFTGLSIYRREHAKSSLGRSTDVRESATVLPEYSRRAPRIFDRDPLCVSDRPIRMEKDDGLT